MTAKKPLHIGMFSDTYLPQINGVVSSIETFKAELEALGHRVTVFGPRIKGGERSTNEVWRFRSMPWPFQPEYRLSSPISRRLKKFEKLKLDIIHFHSPFSMGQLAVFLGKKYNIPVMQTYHTFWAEYIHYVPFLPKKMLKKMDQAFSKTMCNRCAHIIVPSAQMKEKLQEYNVSSEISVLPTGLRLNDIQTISRDPKFESKLGLKPEAKVCIFVGRLGKEKNVMFLLDAFKRIQRSQPESMLLVVGDGPLKEDMIEWSQKNGLSDKVIFTGYLDHEHVFKAYLASDLILFPSVTETQGLSLTEGLATGKPAVCIGKMGVLDVLKNEVGGFLTDGTLDQFCDRALSLLTDEDLYKKKSKEAFERAKSFSAHETTKTLESLYYKVVTTA